MTDGIGSEDDAARIGLFGVGELIAAIPHLMGFHVRDSLVMVVLDEQYTIMVTLRVDLPEPRNLRRLADEMFLSLQRMPGARTIFAVVVGDERSEAGGSCLPLAVRLHDNAEHYGLAITVVGVPEIAEHARWFRYGASGTTGSVPDPNGSLMHLVTAVHGGITRASRDELAELVRPEPAAERDRRAQMVLRARRSTVGDDGSSRSPESTERRFQAVGRAVARAASRVEGLTDDQVVTLGLALSDHQVRDWCLGFAFGDSAAAAERLWLELTRKLPAPLCAEPAALAAIFAYVRGDGALALIAIDRARQATGGEHRLAHLVAHAIELGWSPGQMRAVCENARLARRDFFGG